MELVLNLLWLMLAVPVSVLCWHARQSARGSREYRRLHFCMLAVCLLALLFPVISASDDLNAMRVEFEESSSAPTSIKSATSDSHSHRGSWSVAAVVVCPFSLGFRNEACGEVSQSAPVLPEHVFFAPFGDRAPPLS
jgi:hypothetical protein